jgi:hypothetical protein
MAKANTLFGASAIETDTTTHYRLPNPDALDQKETVL